MQHLSTELRKRQRGFSILEMLLATIILLVGLVAIAQLVPASMLLNYRNRTDSAALVFAQRELDQMLDQPINPTPPQFTDALGNVCALGNPTSLNVVQGNPVVVTSSYNSITGAQYSQTLIDFRGTPATNYSFIYKDHSDPTGAGTTYDVRWAVIITGTSGSVSSMRSILVVQHHGENGCVQRITRYS